MSILDLFRSKQRFGPEQSVLAQLGKVGSDLSKAHNIEFLLYLPTRGAAENVANSIKQHGFEAKVERAAQGDTWLCLATKTMIPELAELERIRANFAELTGRVGGEYDGWGTQVVK